MPVASRQCSVPARDTGQQPGNQAIDVDVLVSIDNDPLEAPVNGLTICRPEILLDRLAGVYATNASPVA